MTATESRTATTTKLACPACGGTDLVRGEFDSTHPDDQLADGDYRNRKCQDCDTAFDRCAGVSVEVAE